MRSAVFDNWVVNGKTLDRPIMWNIASGSQDFSMTNFDVKYKDSGLDPSNYLVMFEPRKEGTFNTDLNEGSISNFIIRNIGSVTPITTKLTGATGTVNEASISFPG